MRAPSPRARRRTPPALVRALLSLLPHGALSLAVGHRDQARARRAAPAPPPPGRPRLGSRAPRRPARAGRGHLDRRWSGRCRRSRTRRLRRRGRRRVLDQLEPRCRRPSFVGVSQTGPALTWSGRPDPVAEAPRRTARDCEWKADHCALPAAIERRRQVHRPVRRERRRRRSSRRGRLVVEEKERSVPARRAPEGSANAISSSAHRGAFSRSWMTSTPPATRRRAADGIAAVRLRFANEVEAGLHEAGGALSSASASLWWRTTRPSARRRSGRPMRRERRRGCRCRAVDGDPAATVKSRRPAIFSASQRTPSSVSGGPRGGSRGLATLLDAAPRGVGVAAIENDVWLVSSSASSIRRYQEFEPSALSRRGVSHRGEYREHPTGAPEYRVG